MTTRLQKPTKDYKKKLQKKKTTKKTSTDWYMWVRVKYWQSKVTINSTVF